MEAEAEEKMIELAYDIYIHIYISFIVMIRSIAKTFGIGRQFYGNLKDSDRIFTNVYKDADPYINGALKRVMLIHYAGRLVPNQRYHR